MCHWTVLFFFFNDTATTEIYTLSLHDALPISALLLPPHRHRAGAELGGVRPRPGQPLRPGGQGPPSDSRRPHEASPRSEEHTSELQSRQYLVCRLLLEKKKKITSDSAYFTHSC